jgi:gas vesicle protein GvpL/GvpF
VRALVYVYAVLPEPVAGELSGIDARPVRWIAEGGLAAAVSDVPSADFDEQPLNERVRDMSWLGPRAVAHQEVNYRLHADSEASVPLTFGTVFRDDDRVRQLLRDQAAVLAERLAAVRGSAEWVVALHLMQEPDAAYLSQASPAVRALREQIDLSAPGRAHLLRRSLAELQRDESRRLQRAAAEDVLSSLGQVAAAAYPEPLPSDTVERPLLRASLLVRREAESRFLDEVDFLRARWPEPVYRLLLTGPWPPYRFGGLREEA